MNEDNVYTQDPAESAQVLEVISVDELLDRLAQDAADPEPVEEVPAEISGMEDVVTILGSIQQQVVHPALTTPFEEYSTSEALLLILCLLTFLAFCSRILREGFSWL